MITALDGIDRLERLGPTISVATLALVLGEPPAKVRRDVERGVWPAERRGRGGRWRIDTAGVRARLEQQTHERA